MSGREIPILFSGPMVRAILEGRKTQTRRVVKPQSLFDGKEAIVKRFPEQKGLGYEVGDRLWVREAFSYDRLDIDKDGTLPPWYWADGNPENGDWTKPKPSIHMPRWASRITLEVTAVKVERLQDISEEDAKAEGVAKPILPHWPERPYASAFRGLWSDINGKTAWLDNPWVVAISFKPSPSSLQEQRQ